MERSDAPPNPGRWEDCPAYYRVELEKFVPLEVHADLRKFAILYDDLLRTEMRERPRNYPFATHGDDPVRLSQGMYLAKVTDSLHELLTIYVDLEVQAGGNQDSKLDLSEEFVEARRRAKEREFFARNPKLAIAAKKHYGLKCMCCGFDFEAVYGELGKSYIDCHHLNPLAERELQGGRFEHRTTIEDVCVLCVNCHRMIHRRRPALSLVELIGLLR